VRAIAITAVLAVATAARAADEADVKLADGPGKDLVVVHCAVCHSLDYIPMNSPFLDRKGWEASVQKMVKVMGAPVPADDVPRIVDYLAAQYGKKERAASGDGR